MSITPKMNLEQVSLRNGYWFYFEDMGLKITAHGSGISGKELIFVDDDIVSSKRAFSMRSKHPFTYGSDHYEVEFSMKNYWSGELECILSKNGQVIQRTCKAYITNNNMKRSILGVFGIAALGAVIGGAVIGFLIGKDLWK